jgi:hypothetical protein
MIETNNTSKPNENLKKVFTGIIKDLRQITRGFQKLHDIQNKEMSENIKKSTKIKQEKYKEKIIQKQNVNREKKILKYHKDKGHEGDKHGGILGILASLLSFSKILLVGFVAFGIMGIIGKTEMGKLLISLITAIAKAFISVAKDLYGILVTALKESSKYIVEAVKAIFAGIGDFFKFIAGALTGANGYKKLDLAGIMDFFLKEVVVKAFLLAKDIFIILAKLLTKIIKENAESIKNGFVALMTSLFDTIKTVVQTVIKTLYSDAGKAGLTGIFDSLNKIVLNLWELLKAAWVAEFKDEKGNTKTFGDIITKYFLVWAGLKIGMIALTGTMLKFAGAMAAFFDEIDAAKSVKCCCNNMANNILDVAEEIEKPKGRQSGGYREKIGKNSRLPTRKPDYGKTASGYGKVNMTVGNVPVDLPDSRRPGKIGKPGLGSVIGAGCSMACDLAERIVEASKKGVTKVAEVLSKSKNVVIQAGKTGWDWLSNGAKKIWGAVTDFGEKVAQKAANLGKSVVNFVIEKFKNYSRYIVAMVKDSKIGKKVVELAVKRLGPAIERLFAKLALAVAGVATGGVMTAVFTVLAAIDMAMLAYGLYELFFVEPPEGGGLYKEIKQMVDDWWKTQTEPSKEAPPAVPPCQPLAKPVAAPAPVTKPLAAPAAPPAPPPASTFTGMGGTSSKSVAQPAPASAPVPASAPAPTVTPAPVAPTQPLTTASTSVSVPTAPSTTSSKSLDELKAQVIGGKLNNGGPRQKTVAAIIHHTGGRGLEATLQTLQNRGLSYHYLIDRDGRIVQSLPDNLVAWHAHPNDKKPSLTNANTVGIATVAKDDSDLTPEQIASAVTLEDALAKKYGFPKTDVFGHGEVSSHKHPQEGSTIVKAIRGGAMPSKELNIENAKIPTMSPGGQSYQGSQTINESMQQRENDLKELGNMLLDDLMNLRSNLSSGDTAIVNNNLNVVNQKAPSNKVFTNVGDEISSRVYRNVLA